MTDDGPPMTDDGGRRPAAVRAWLARIEALPGFVPMPRTAAGLQA